jgi:hypothetical protein
MMMNGWNDNALGCAARRIMPTEEHDSAWQHYIDALEALGINPYDAEKIPKSDARYPSVQAIIAELKASRTCIPELPQNWEGPPPAMPLDSLNNLKEWLESEGRTLVGWQLGSGEQSGLSWSTFKPVARAIRNAHRKLDDLGYEDALARPSKPEPTTSPYKLKEQIDELVAWIRELILSGKAKVREQSKPIPTDYVWRYDRKDKLWNVRYRYGHRPKEVLTCALAGKLKGFKDIAYMLAEKKRRIACGILCGHPPSSDAKLDTTTTEQGMAERRTRIRELNAEIKDILGKDVEYQCRFHEPHFGRPTRCTLACGKHLD